VSCATAQNSAMRQRCSPLVKKIMTGLSTYAPAQASLTEFNKFLENVKIRSESDKENKEDTSMGEITGRCLADRLFAQVPSCSKHMPIK